MLKASSFLLLGFLLPFSTPVHAETMPYRLGIVIVVDQFRADYLMRFKSDFAKDGYRELMEHGAYFPLADHGLLQNMTGPGHAAILSGSYPYRNGIPLNFWYDRAAKKEVYCVQDDSAKLIGSHGEVKGQGESPRNFNATTLGDELKNVDRASRVVSIAMKDRSAILLGGRRTDATLWMNGESCEWVTSDFYSKTLPGFAKKANEHLAQIKDKPYSWGPYPATRYCSHDSFQTPWSIQETFDLAVKAIDEMKLGNGSDTDLLTISLSAPDYLGHSFGPNHPAMHEMAKEEDKRIAAFLAEAAKRVPGGMKNIFVVLTGDHGIPPSASAIPAEKLKTGNVPVKEVSDAIENALTAEFGKPSEGKWVVATPELQIYLSEKSVNHAKTTMSHIGALLRSKLQNDPYIEQIWAKDEILIDRKIPPGEYGKVVDRTVHARSGDLIVVLKPFFYSDPWYTITHMTLYSYDRYVPLIFWGKTFKPGTYRQIVNIADVAPTLSSVLNVLPPSQSEGRVLTEILR